MSPIALESLSISSNVLKTWKRSTKPVDAEGLVAALTLEEKVSLLSGRSFCDTPDVPRLGVASIKVSDGPAGCRGELSHDGPASAVFPNASCLASSFDPALVERIGAEIGKECQLKSTQLLMGPTINLHRDPRGGRNFECFSEDPVVTGLMGSAYVKGLQSQRVGACLKHLVCNERETRRKAYDVQISEKALREVYLRPFEMIIKDAEPYSIMTAYNDINGQPSSHSKEVLDIVRNEFGYDGLIMSDWFGTKDGVASLKAGVDLEMPFPVMRAKRVVDQVRSGELEEHYVNTAVRRMIDTAAKTNAPLTRPAERAYDDDKTRSALCRQAAAEGMVLLRNNAQLLPLRSDANVLVVGEHAVRPSISGGGSALLNPPYVSAPLDAIRGATSGRVVYHPGVPTWRLVPELDARFTNEVHVTLTNDGDEKPLWGDRRPKASISLLDQRIDGLGPEFTTTMEATVTAAESGKHTLSVFCVAETQVYLDDTLLTTLNPPHISVEQFLFERFDFENRISVDIEAGTTQTLRVVSKSKGRTGHEPPAQGLRVGLVKDVEVDAALDELEAMAADAEHIVVMTGLNPDWEGEGSDRVDLKLPRQQEDMLRRLAKYGHKVALVNQSGGPVDLSCASGLSSIIQAFYGGMECGNAIADVLFGSVNPSGRLAMTFPASLETCPTYTSFHDDKDGLFYREEELFGYRTYQHQGVLTAYPFGYGQSYTTFEWSGATVTQTEGAVDIQVTVTNTGSRSGRDVIQAYVSNGADEPRKVEGIAKTAKLAPGFSETLRLSLDPRAFARWSGSSWAVSGDTWRVSLCSDVETEKIGLDVSAPRGRTSSPTL